MCTELNERKDSHTNTGKMFQSEETAREGLKFLRISKKPMALSQSEKLGKWKKVKEVSQGD